MCICVPHTCTWCLWRLGEVIGSPMTGVTDGCALVCECCVLNLGLQEVFLAIEPFLQSLTHINYMMHRGKKKE